MAEDRRRPDHRPSCPGCGDRMPLTRVVPRGNYVWEQVVFQCHCCEIAVTQAGDGGQVGEAGYGPELKFRGL
jgi:hypothetical protein